MLSPANTAVIVSEVVSVTAGAVNVTVACPELSVVDVSALRVPALTLQVISFPDSGAPLVVNVAIRLSVFSEPITKEDGKIVSEVEDKPEGETVPEEVAWLEL